MSESVHTDFLKSSVPSLEVLFGLDKLKLVEGNGALCQGCVFNPYRGCPMEPPAGLPAHAGCANTTTTRGTITINGIWVLK